MNRRQKFFIIIIIVAVLASSYFREFIRSDKATKEVLNDLKTEDHKVYERQLNDAHLTLLHATMREIAILLQTKEVITHLAPQDKHDDFPTTAQLDALLDQTKHLNDHIKTELSHAPTPFKLYHDKITASKARSKQYQTQLKQIVKASQKTVKDSK